MFNNWYGFFPTIGKFITKRDKIKSRVSNDTDYHITSFSLDYVFNNDLVGTYNDTGVAVIRKPYRFVNLTQLYDFTEEYIDDGLHYYFFRNNWDTGVFSTYLNYKQLHVYAHKHNDMLDLSFGNCNHMKINMITNCVRPTRHIDQYSMDRCMSLNIKYEY